MTVIHKSSVSPIGPGLEYVLSDETKDRMGDIIEARGWDLSHFGKNPIALFGHNSSFPIGRWKNVRVQGKQLKGQLELAPEGTSARIDEIRRLAEHGFLRAVSVGFHVKEKEALDPKDPWSGIRFKKQELLECSLVAVPANPNAVQLAKSLVSEATIAEVFGEQAGGAAVTQRAIDGEKAETHKAKRNSQMTPLSQRIEDAQKRYNELRDKLTEHTGKIEGEPNDEQIALIDELNEQIAAAEKALGSLKKAEQALASRSEPIATEQRGQEMTVTGRPFAQPKQKQPNGFDMLVRAALVGAVAKATGAPSEWVVRDRYGNDEATRLISGHMLGNFAWSQKASVVPATTTGSGWADSLIQTVVEDFFQALVANSIYPGLANKGTRVTFGSNGAITIPSRTTSASLGGAFVLQGNPIPVKQGSFTTITLVPKKLGVITTLTREIAEHSTPSLEGIIRQAILDDTSVAIDSVLLDATAASTTRPAGLKNGVTGSAVSTGTGFAALMADLQTLVSALISSTSGNVRQPTWVINPADVLRIATTQNAGGDLPFKDELQGGTLFGYPVLQSATVTTAKSASGGFMMLLDAADFVSVTGDTPRFDVSDQAVLHMEDTTPAPLATTTTAVAAPIRSLWQTDTIAIRMLLDMNWAMRRTGMVAYLPTSGSTVAW